MLSSESGPVERVGVAIAQFGQQWLIPHLDSRPLPEVAGTQDRWHPRIETTEMESPQRLFACIELPLNECQSTLMDVPRCRVDTRISQYMVVEESGDKVEPTLLIDSHPGNIGAALPAEPFLHELQECHAYCNHREAAAVVRANPQAEGFARQAAVARHGRQHMGNHDHSVSFGRICHRFQRVEDHDVAVDVDGRVGTGLQKVLEHPRFDSGDESAPKKHGHPVKLGELDIEVRQAQNPERFARFVDLVLDIIDQQGPEPTIGMMFGKGSCQYSGMRHICPRDDRERMDTQDASPLQRARPTGVATLDRGAALGTTGMLSPGTSPFGPRMETRGDGAQGQRSDGMWSAQSSAWS